MFFEKMKSFGLITILGLACLSTLPVWAKQCEQKSLCSCTFEDGTEVDITSLGNTDGTPRFKDVLAHSEGNYYSYNPCVGFTEGQCSDASVCILNPDKSESVQIGDSQKAGFKYDEASNTVVVAYTSGSLSNLKLSEILLVCDQSACDPSIVANGQQQGGEFQMTLTTVCACPGGCSASGPKACSSGGSGSGSGGLGVGSVLCIVFFAGLVVYLIAGVVFMKVRSHANGSDLIPNKTFWGALPGLIVTGFKFTFSKCLPKKYSYDAV